MKKYSLLFIMLLLVNIANAQVNKVQNGHSIKGPLVGLSYAYEQAISQTSTIDFELIVNGGFGSSIFYDSYWVIAPVLRIEPRYYYNFLKRYNKEKKTINNSANYLALELDFQPGISIGKNAEAVPYFDIVPKYGLRRTMGRHFIFEIAAGVGAYIIENEGWDSIIAIDLKLGYAF